MPSLPSPHSQGTHVLKATKVTRTSPLTKVVILDFGSQYTQVIARRIRELEIFSEIVPFTTKASELKRDPSIGAIILSGGPASVLTPGAPRLDKKIYQLGIPILGICYGMQLLAKDLGGKVARSAQREYGDGLLTVKQKTPLFSSLPKKLSIWNSHGDHITELPGGFEIMGTTENAPHAAIGDRQRHFYGLQFHPEVAHTPEGKAILHNFLCSIAKIQPSWTMESFIESSCDQIRATVGSDQVILGLSGGVDSSVAAALIHKAIGKQLTCIFVDNGLLRAGEAEQVRQLFGDHFQMKLKFVKAHQRFLKPLKGVSDPEKKRKIIGETFIKVFEETAATLQKGSQTKRTPIRFLAQGTLYPDVIESVPIGNNPAALIKSHHNVGGLPKKMKLKLLEPLRSLFKDEVRAVGHELGLPAELIDRHPFPGPGLAVRILGSITTKDLNILRQADQIVIEEMRRSGWYHKVWQAFAVLLPVRSVGVMGDERTYEKTVALRVIQSQDGMTANWAHLPHTLLATISHRIINEVNGINRAVYDISNKPPATIEWE